MRRDSGGTSGPYSYRTASCCALLPITVQVSYITKAFRVSQTQASANKLNFIGVYEHYDEPDIAAVLAERIVSDYPDIGGLYFNSANSVSFCKRLIELGLGREIKIVASDIMPEIAGLIKEEVIDFSIFANPYLQGEKEPLNTCSRISRTGRSSATAIYY